MLQGGRLCCKVVNMCCEHPCVGDRWCCKVPGGVARLW